MAASAFSKLELTAACTVYLRPGNFREVGNAKSVDLAANWVDTAQGISGVSAEGHVFFPWDQVSEVRGT